MQVFEGFVDLIWVFSQIVHGIRAKSTVACSVFGEKENEGLTD